MAVTSLVGIAAGSASAIFLLSLDAATQWRELHLWIIYLMPLAGLITGLAYHHFGSKVAGGNNRLIDEIDQPQQRIPFRMAPMVLIGTLLTNITGGSAGREGTAVQMGGAIADQLTLLFKFSHDNRRTLLISGISAGFAAVFGTPVAGAIFAIEVLTIGKIRYESILPAFLSAMVANYTCQLWGVGHTHYSLGYVPAMEIKELIYTIAAGVAFGLTALLFSKSADFWSRLFGRIRYIPLRASIGGAIVATLIISIGAYDYAGLGINIISNSFVNQQPAYMFIIKLLLTTITISAGFKGGEVTPLFFVGAALGSAMSALLPLPVGLMAGMGFVAVFAGATNTPIACIMMGIELFGAQGASVIAIACVVAYIFSGHTGIYQSQMIATAKSTFLNIERGKRIDQL